MTMGPGTEVWEKFGHDAIWVHDALAGTDWVYNYGMFDFNQEHFFSNFILGTMWYWMAADLDAAYTLQLYREDHRSVWVQELNLTPRQRADLRDFLVCNQMPKNRFYHYDYYLDNCTTRVRDALDRVLDGQLKAQTQDVPTHSTYRTHTRRAMSGDPLLYTALEFILGRPVDRPLSAWQEMFLPLQMRDHIRRVKVRDEQGNLVPLVKTDITLYQGSDGGVPDRPPTWWPWYLLIGLAGGGVFAWLGTRTPAARRWRVLFGILAVPWTFLLGAAGCFLLWGELFTNHVAIYHNENLLHFSPLALPLVILIPWALRGKPWAARAARWLAAAVLLIGLAGLLLKILPSFYQSNWDMIAWTLPTNLGLAWGVWRMRGKKCRVAVADDGAPPADRAPLRPGYQS